MYDIIIIGAGPAGYEGAAIAASQGLQVLLVERDALGGTCLNRGCIPTKCFCRSAEVAYTIAQEAENLGVVAGSGEPQVVMPRVAERKNQVVATLRQGVEQAVSRATVVYGEARFTGSHEITVKAVDGTETTATSPKIIIASGSEPATLPIPGADLALDSTAMLQAEIVPPSLIIIGGGVIGMEFASIFAAFGSHVTVIEYCPQVLPPFDKDIARRLAKELQARGVDIHLSSAVTAISRADEGFRVTFTTKGKELAVEGSQVLMAVGRRAVAPAGLTEHTKASVGRRGIEVDDDFQTAEPGIYAVGDCNGRCMLAHAATAQMKHVLGLPVNLSVIPSAVFTIPECAMAGLTEEQAKTLGVPLKVAKIPMRANGKAQAMGLTSGLVKMIARADDGQILGCSVMGPDAADLVAEVALAMAHHLTAADICTTIHSHPSLSEAILAAALMVND